MLQYEFTLDKKYLEECFDQSAPFSPQKHPRYWFVVTFISLGCGLILFSDTLNGIGAYMLLALGLIELISFRYRRAWWLTRQMWSRAANSKVNITLLPTEIRSVNPYTDSIILLNNLASVKRTEFGFLLIEHCGKQHYVSRKPMSEAAIDFFEFQLALFDPTY